MKWFAFFSKLKYSVVSQCTAYEVKKGKDIGWNQSGFFFFWILSHWVFKLTEETEVLAEMYISSNIFKIFTLAKNAVVCYVVDIKHDKL